MVFLTIFVQFGGDIVPNYFELMRRHFNSSCWLKEFMQFLASDPLDHGLVRWSVDVTVTFIMIQYY